MKIGIDLGGSHVGVGLIEGDKLIIVENKYFTPEDLLDSKNAIVKNIDELIYKIITENDISMDKIEAIGAASPGTIASGKIRSWNLKLDWFDLQSILANKYNKRVRVRNDGKCAALAEKKYGILKDYDDAVFINIGTGIGGAAFINGNFLEPKRFSGFEFGHMTVLKDGIECSCGKRGCFERYSTTFFVFSAWRSSLSERVSTPCKRRNALKGEIQAPVSLSRIALIYVTKAAGPTASTKDTPW